MHEQCRLCVLKIGTSLNWALAVVSKNDIDMSGFYVFGQEHVSGYGLHNLIKVEVSSAYQIVKKIKFLQQ